ncbi:MAG: hypothetical protein HQ522_02840 [Bacteroidetes bacterium]|nr:hypothetical protein [Bacteroidota bacterium]
MKIVKFLFFIFCLLTFGANSGKAHPFYVSICQVDFNKKNHSLEISLKVFANDLLLGLKNAGRSKIYLGEEKENPNTDEYIFDYLKPNLKFKVNDTSQVYSFIGREIETDVIWVYLEIKDISELKKIEVECKLLTEVLDSQNNIIQINNGDGIKSLLLNKRKQRDTLIL